MDWLFLILAGFFEIGWPLGFKLSQIMQNKFPGLIAAGISMSLSGLLLWHAQKTIPIGTAYAVWTGIGAAGTFIVGVLIFKDAFNFIRIISILFIIIGVAGLKLSN
jgi:quaternary ammonium compound-resistance protein SugE